MDRKSFQVYIFISRDEILAHPDTLTKSFPKILHDKIRAKAGAKE